MPRQKDLSWKAYKDIYSHNIMTLGTRPASKGFPRGPGAILGTINKFPQTNHPLTDATKFVVDGWVINNGVVGANLGSSDKSSLPTKPDALLFISVQGEFAELPSLGVRSFSRCFVVAPVPPGSTAANLGWPCVIISDQLTIRQYAGTNAWNPALSTSADASSANANTSTNANTNLASLPGHLKGIAAAPGLVSGYYINFVARS
jgi:nuclear RNA export factor